MKIDRQDYKRIKRTLNSTRFIWWLLLFSGLIFIAVGGAFAYFCRSLLNDIGFTVFYGVFLAAFFAIGLVCVIFALRQLTPYFSDLHTLKRGVPGTAVIVGSRVLHVGTGTRLTSGSKTYYSLTLKFEQDGEEKTYVTRYYYDEKQFEFLTRRNGVGIRQLNGRAVVVQEFPEFDGKFKDLPRKMQWLTVINLAWVLLSFALIVCGVVLSALKLDGFDIVFVLSGMASLVGSVIMKAILLAKAENAKGAKKKRHKK